MDNHQPGAKVVPRAEHLRPKGAVSPLCRANRPKAIDLKVESWTLVDAQVTCDVCRAILQVRMLNHMAANHQVPAHASPCLAVAEGLRHLFVGRIAVSNGVRFAGAAGREPGRAVSPPCHRGPPPKPTHGPAAIFGGNALRVDSAAHEPACSSVTGLLGTLPHTGLREQRHG